MNSSSRDRYDQDGLSTEHDDHFRQDPRFKEAYARGIEAAAGFDPRHEWRVHTVLWTASIALQVEGDFVECGVNAGFMSSAIIASHRMDPPKTTNAIRKTACWREDHGTVWMRKSSGIRSFS